MTVKDLFMSISFDELLPFLKEYEANHLDNIYTFREAYDILRNMEPNKDYQNKVTIVCNAESDYDGRKVFYLDDDVWENELAKEIVFKGDAEPDMCEVAMYCLWELTFYGFSPSQRISTFDKMFNGCKPVLRYEIALDKLEESIWKHQTPRRLRYKDEKGRS